MNNEEMQHVKINAFNNVSLTTPTVPRISKMLQGQDRKHRLAMKDFAAPNFVSFRGTSFEGLPYHVASRCMRTNEV